VQKETYRPGCVDERKLVYSDLVFSCSRIFKVTIKGMHSKLSEKA
jgi:hypothetical protein